MKGVSVLLMLVHHLFGLPSLVLPENQWLPLLPGLPLEYWLGRFGKICVALFLLLSGYGLTVRGRAERPAYFAARAIRFWWAYFWVFMPVALLAALLFSQGLPHGRAPLIQRWDVLIGQALTLGRPLVYEWWFAQTYLLLVLIAPLLIGHLARPRALLAASIVAFLAGAAIDGRHLNPPLISLSNLLIWQQPFVLGMIWAAQVETGPSKRAEPADTPSFPFAASALLLIVTGFALVETTIPRAMTPYLILCTPLACWLLWRWSATKARGAIGSALAWTGKRSLEIWLIHPLLSLYFWQDVTYAPRWSPLIFMALVIMTLAIALPIEAARRNGTLLFARMIRRHRAVRV